MSKGGGKVTIDDKSETKDPMAMMKRLRLSGIAKDPDTNNGSKARNGNDRARRPWRLTKNSLLKAGAEASAGAIKALSTEKSEGAAAARAEETAVNKENGTQRARQMQSRVYVVMALSCV